MIQTFGEIKNTPKMAESLRYFYYLLLVISVDVFVFHLSSLVTSLDICQAWWKRLLVVTT